MSQTPSYLDNGEGQALVLIHGSLSDYRYWRAQTPHFEKNYRVLAPSMSHFWPICEDTRQYNVKQHASEVVDLLDDLQIEKAHILGHSRGASIALRLAQHWPDRVKSLILADPSLQHPDDPELANRNVAKSALEHLTPTEADFRENASEYFIDAVSGEGAWKRLVPWFKEMVIDNAHTLEYQSHEPVPVLDPQELNGLDQNLKISIIGGASSPKAFVRTSKRLAEIWPNAQLDFIEHASHGLNLTHPHIFNDLIQKHLDAVTD